MEGTRPLGAALSGHRADTMRTLIGGVGARDSRDNAIGVLVSDRLAQDAPIAAARVVVEDLSFDPVEVAERLNNEWPRFERVIFVGAVARARPAGTVAAYRWDGELPTGDRMYDAFAAADDGVVSLENTLLIVKQMADLPDEVIVVEVEPEVAASEQGDALSPAVSAAFERARTLVRRLATNSRAAADLPKSALGGGTPGSADLAD